MSMPFFDDVNLPGPTIKQTVADEIRDLAFRMAQSEFQATESAIHGDLVSLFVQVIEDNFHDVLDDEGWFDTEALAAKQVEALAALIREGRKP